MKELLMLTSVAVKTELQRQHISRDILEYGFDIAKRKGFKAVLVEGNPKNYRNRGFRPSYELGIEAGPNVHLPHRDCLMIKELVEGGAEYIKGFVDYSFYNTLHEGSYMCRSLFFLNGKGVNYLAPFGLTNSPLS